jgi:uncharacterized protein
MNLAHFPLVTAATAIVLALLQIGLMLHVGFGRMQSATGLGDGGDEGLLRRIRMHGNLAENAPLFLILLGLTELTGDWGLAIPAVAAFFVLCRLAHPIGLSRSSGASPLRGIGAMGTALAYICTAVLLTISLVGKAGLHA